MAGTWGRLSGQIIAKDRAALRPPPNLLDYETECAAFTWDKALSMLDGLPGGKGLNIAHEAVDRHAAGALADKVALRWIGRAGARRSLTYADLRNETNRFANALQSLGVESGERIFLLMGRLPELHIAMLGAFKARCAVTPLFSAFGPEPIAMRMEIGDARVLVTTPALYARKVAPIRDQLPGLAHVILVGEGEAQGSGLHDWVELVAPASPEYDIAPTGPEDMALLHFTSGTTGKPKGAIHVHQSVVAHHVTGRYALDLHESDVFWCTADPGWVTGTSYGIIAPLTNGVTSLVVEAEFDPAVWYDVLEAERVSVWYTAPTAIRMMMRQGPDAACGRDLSALRFMASVGEPLNPEVVSWGMASFGLPFHDNW